MASLTDLTKAIEATIAQISSNKVAYEKAKKTAADAEKAYLDSVNTIRALHADYQTLMNDILSFGGTVHIGNPR